MSELEQQPELLLSLEALIFASDTPMSVARLQQALGNTYSSADIRQDLQQLAV